MTNSTPIIPVLVYADIAAAHDFFVSAFGFQSGGLSRDGEGIVVHGEVRAGGVPIWLHRISAEHALTAADAADARSGGLVVNVEDVDAHFAHARGAGAEITGEPVDQPYGRREYGARDPEGHHWWFGTPLPG